MVYRRGNDSGILNSCFHRIALVVCFLMLVANEGLVSSFSMKNQAAINMRSAMASLNMVTMSPRPDQREEFLENLMISAPPMFTKDFTKPMSIPQEGIDNVVEVLKTGNIILVLRYFFFFFFFLPLPLPLHSLSFFLFTFLSLT